VAAASRADYRLRSQSDVLTLSLLSFAAALFSVVLALVGLLRKRPTPAAWLFFAGMTILGIDSMVTGLALRATRADEVVRWLTLGFAVKSFVPVVWLAFSLTYSRGNYRQFLAGWKLPLALFALPPIVSIAFLGQLFQLVPLGTAEAIWRLQFGVIAKVVNGFLLVGLVLILMNLEQTFRSAVGTMRWRIKFVVVAFGVIFGTRLYVRAQTILFSAPEIGLSGVESGALLIGCVFLTIAYARTGLAEIDVYPSAAVLRSSVTLLIVGGYLFAVGVLAELVRRFGGSEFLQLQGLVVVLGLGGLSVLLLSDRFRQRVRAFVGRHFSKAQHDSVQIWTLFSRQLAMVHDQAALCTASAKLISETFEVLSVSVWLLDEKSGQLTMVASTVPQPADANDGRLTRVASDRIVAGLHARPSPFDLEEVNEPWAAEWRQLNPAAFPEKGGNRWCMPLKAGDKGIGAIVLADRVNAAVYTVEETELLKCIGDHVTSVLLNLRLANEVAQGRELEAFRTMSAFFVHDLKNAAASLNLILKNLPVHFDNPAFREDALRAVGNTARRIDEMIGRLSALRQRPDFTPVDADLNELVSESLDRLDAVPDVDLTRELHPLPRVLADRQQIHSVVTNLVLNARDAVGQGGRVHVRTDHQGSRVVLSVADNGCGMTPAFVKESLFRPFQSTKKNGLGIGMFQARLVVERHGGSIQVDSEAGKGSTIRISFPVKDEQ
jgi:putative PEP-CTERM system histidine kinase